MAKKLGADVVINGAKQDLASEVMAQTEGNGVSRLIEASGSTPMVNLSFTLIRKVKKSILFFRICLKIL